jgi:hypothetical protein
MRCAAARGAAPVTGRARWENGLVDASVVSAVAIIVVAAATVVALVLEAEDPGRPVGHTLRAAITVHFDISEDLSPGDVAVPPHADLFRHPRRPSGREVLSDGDHAVRPVHELALTGACHGHVLMAEHRCHVSAGG